MGPARDQRDRRARLHADHRGHGAAPRRRDRLDPRASVDRRGALPRGPEGASCRRASPSPTARGSRSPRSTSALGASRGRAHPRAAAEARSGPVERRAQGAAAARAARVLREARSYGYARGGMPVAFVDRVRAYYDILLRHERPHRAAARAPIAPPSTPRPPASASSRIMRARAMRAVARSRALAARRARRRASPRAPAPVFLDELTSTELRDAIRAGKTTIIVPIGGTEQNGPHMALGKHNVRVAAARRADRARARQRARRAGDRLRARRRHRPADRAHALSRDHHRAGATRSQQCSNPPRAASGCTAFATSCSSAITAATRRDNRGGRGAAQPRVGGDAGARARDRRVLPRRRRREFAATLQRRGFSDDEIGTHAGLADTSLMLALDARARARATAARAPPPPTA